MARTIRIVPPHHLIAALALDTLLRPPQDQPRDVPAVAPNSFLIDRKLERAARRRARDRQPQLTGSAICQSSPTITPIADMRSRPIDVGGRRVSGGG